MRGYVNGEKFDGRQLELTALFELDGDFEFDPYAVDGGNWEAEKLAYGRQVALQVADRAVLQMAMLYGFTGQAPPEAHIKGRNSLSGSLEMGWATENAMAIRQLIGGVIRLNSDRELEVGELILAARDLIAADVAGHAIFALEHRFEEKQKAYSETTIRREGGQIVEFQRRNKPPLPDPEGDRKMAA